MDKKMMMIVAGVVAAVVVIAAVAFVVLNNGSEGEPLKATFNGKEYSYDDMAEKFGTKTVGGQEGVPLDAIVTDSGVTGQGTYAYVLQASDGYAMAVNWTEMQKGIVTQVSEEKDGETTTYLMTVFPGMPSAYKVKNFNTVTNKQMTPITLNGLEYYTDYMPKKVSEKTVVYNATYNATGYSLSDMVNYTGLASPQNHTYKVIANDNYSKTVTWTSMMNGVIVKTDTKTVFPGLAKGYMVKNVVKIEVL